MAFGNFQALPFAAEFTVCFSDFAILINGLRTPAPHRTQVAGWTILDRSGHANAVEFPVLDNTPVRYLTILPNSRCPNFRYFTTLLLAAWLVLAGCGHKEVILVEGTKYYEGAMPADFSGSWARDYARGDDVGEVFQSTIWQLGKRRERSGSGVPRASERDVRTLIPIARLAELITRPDVLTISQTEHEILVERRDDFSLMCAFFDGVAKSSESAFGSETCGWEGDRLISIHDMPDGLRVLHRFHVSDDGRELRVITSVSSSTAPAPITIDHYYWKFEKVPGKLECIETLSMKRVCSTGKLEL